MPAHRAVAPSRATSGWSLERRLPLLILALLATVMGVFSAAAYREVRSASISRSTERLERVARELTTMAGRNSAARLPALRALAAESTIVDAVLTGATPSTRGLDMGQTVPFETGRAATATASARVAAVLAATRRPNDSTLLGWEVWTLDGDRRYGGTRDARERDSLVLAATRAQAARTDSILRSPLFAVDSAIHAWTVVPIRVGERTVGLLAELRRLNNSARTEETIRQLTGEDVHMLYTSRGSADWASLRGTPTTAPFTVSMGEDTAAHVVGTDGRPLYVVQGQVPGTPWRIVLLQSQASVLRRPDEFLRTLLGIGAVLLALGTVGAWLLGRHVARPLRRVTDAAAALAGGDYSQRVRATGATEVVGLASTFNAMAAGLGDAHATLAERRDALERANEAKSQFLAMMSHELRTPLNAIGGYTELIELGLRGPVTSEQIADLGRIRRNKDHLLSIITDILSFARADAGALTLTYTDVAVGDLFRDAVDTFGPQFQAKGVRLVVDPPPADALVRGDPDKVQQILLNLLSNALKFTERSGEVVLTCSVGANAVRLEVRDTGVGIAPDRQDEIFEPFVQVDAALTRRVGGTGLGLSIARHLTVAMGGHLTVESTPGKGSRFVAALPRAQGPDPTQPQSLLEARTGELRG